MILLDTHVWWWSISEPEKLSECAYKKIQATSPGRRAISSISIWEFAMMASRKKIELQITPGEWLAHALGKTGIKVIEISPDIALDACNLPGEFHKDPADRIIVATARVNNMPLIPKDERILNYSQVKGVW
jgi:PIN domain nuclease of toxin-antitoxin system